MARVKVLREARSGSPGEWQLCFQWCRYDYDEPPPELGYRFVWRRDDERSSIQAARGQARIPSMAQAQALMDQAITEGWGNRDGNRVEEAVERLQKAGCVVNIETGYVGWPDKEAAQSGRLTAEILSDERIVSDWTR